MQQKLEKRDADYKALLAAQKAEKARLNSELTVVQRSVADSDKKLEALKRASDRAAESYKASEAKRKAELEALRLRLKQAESLKAEVRTRDTKIGQFDKQVVSLKQSVDSQQASVVALKKQVKDSQTVASQREKELNKLRPSIKTLEANMARQRSETEATRNCLLYTSPSPRD